MFLFHSLYLIKGFLVGFSVAAPIGPVAIFCIRQTLAFGRRAGLAAGLGVAFADAVYSWVAAYSASLVQKLIHTYAKWFYLLGGCFLLFLGINILRSRLKHQEGDDTLGKNLWKSFYKTLLLTVASPMTTLLFIGMFSAYGVFEAPLKEMQLPNLVLGVFFGAMTWWALLAFTVKFVQKKLGHHFFKYVNAISGILILGYGVVTLVKFLTTFF